MTAAIIFICDQDLDTILFFINHTRGQGITSITLGFNCSKLLGAIVSCVRVLIREEPPNLPRLLGKLHVLVSKIGEATLCVYCTIISPTRSLAIILSS